MGRSPSGAARYDEIEGGKPPLLSDVQRVTATSSSPSATLVILNREPTDLDGIADFVIHREIGPTLGEAANVN